MKDTNICGIVKNIIDIEKDGDTYSNVEYKRGEMDVLHISLDGVRTYYEIKCSDKEKYILKGIKQVKRAIKYGECDKGYVVTPKEWFEINK